MRKSMLRLRTMSATRLAALRTAASLPLNSREKRGGANVPFTSSCFVAQDVLARRSLSSSFASCSRSSSPSPCPSTTRYRHSSKTLVLRSVRRRSFRSDGGDVSNSTYVLGIETSCDDTAAAVVSGAGKVLGESIISSVELQAKWGGVVPALAQQAHMDAIDEVVDETLRKSGLRPDQLSGVAVTIGPGLSLCLKVGVLKAREVAYASKVPLIPVHHMEAHSLVARILTQSTREPSLSSSSAAAELSDGCGSLEFPFLALLVSGGHNLLVLVEGIGSYKILGTTLDDAVGEAYDKVARLLGLDLSSGGGPAVEALALEGDPLAFDFPVPLRNSKDKAKNCDFSFAGLKTCVRTRVESCVKDGDVKEERNRQVRADIAASFQHVAVKHLCLRTKTAISWVKESHPEVQALVVAGGVAANKVLRRELESLARESGVKLVCPPPKYCTDNGVMVAWTGMERLKGGIGVGEIPESAKPEEGEFVELRPRWPLGELDERCSQQRKKIRSVKTKGIKMSLTKETSLLMAAEKARLQRTTS